MTEQQFVRVSTPATRNVRSVGTGWRSGFKPSWRGQRTSADGDVEDEVDVLAKSLATRFGRQEPAPENPTPVEAMAHRLKTPEGRALYALRKQTPEPVFGIIKSALGFRQFSLRGLDKVRGEWSLVTMAWNLKRMFVLAPA